MGRQGETHFTSAFTSGRHLVCTLKTDSFLHYRLPFWLQPFSTTRAKKREKSFLLYVNCALQPCGMRKASHVSLLCGIHCRLLCHNFLFKKLKNGNICRYEDHLLLQAAVTRHLCKRTGKGKAGNYVSPATCTQSGFTLNCTKITHYCVAE